ncbi:hypothetical protein ACTFIW_004730 [Dictyostelium discoideum]
MEALNNPMSAPFFSFVVKVIGIWIIFFGILKLIYIKYKDQIDIDGFLERTNLSVQLFYIGFSTTRLNSMIKSISNGRYERFWYYWFKIGSWVSLSLLPLSIGLLVYNLFIIFIKPTGIEPVISPIVPGVNVKGSDSWYLIISVLISMIIHELGHAIASYVSKCEINSIGFFFLFIMPGASVNLDYIELDKINLWQKLRIQCGGVWHNVVLCIIGYLLLSSSSFLLSPLYKISNDKLYITGIPNGSLLERNLNIGDQILSINDCKISNRSDLVECIYKELDKTRSYCISQNTITCLENVFNNNNNNNNNNTNVNLSNVNNKKINLINQIDNDKRLRECFGINDATTLVECVPVSIDSPSECAKSKKECINFNQFNYHIFHLNLLSQDFDNVEQLSFLGTAQQLWDSFIVNNYQSRFVFLNGWDLPWYFNQFFSYLIPVSAGLAAFNAIAIPNMDGEHILETILSIIFLKFGGSASGIDKKNSPNNKINKTKINSTNNNNNNNSNNNKESSSSSSSSSSSLVLSKKEKRERLKLIISKVIKVSTILLFGLTVILSFYNLKYQR